MIRTLALAAALAAAALLSGCDKCGRFDLSVCERAEAPR